MSSQRGKSGSSVALRRRFRLGWCLAVGTIVSVCAALVYPVVVAKHQPQASHGMLLPATSPVQEQPQSPQPKSSRPRYQTLPDAIRLHKLGVDIEGDEDVTAVYTGTGEADYGDSDLACLASWSHLRTVKLAGPRLTLASVQYLCGLKELKKLYVGVGGGPEEQALSVISGLTQFD